MAARIDTFAKALKAAKPRPPQNASPTTKKNYAERLSRHLATLVANSLRDTFPIILPRADGTRQESLGRASRGPKKLDVNYSTPELGLGLGVSIKTLNYRDGKTRRYTKNYTRIDNELRAEAMDYHLRQPYAVMVAIVFLPFDCCDDSRRDPSSFAQAVRSFRHRGGRNGARDEEQKFERVFLGLYEYAGDHEGHVEFFDVRHAPVKKHRPKKTMDFTALRDAIRAAFDERNDPPFEWGAE